MNITKSERRESKLYTGIFLGKPVIANPSYEQLMGILGAEGKEDAEEIKYTGEDKDKNETVTVSFWLEDELSKQKFNARFRIVDKILTSEKSGKIAYVNVRGMQTWVDDAKNLPEWFTHFTDKDKKPIAECNYRKAMQGEEQLYAFLRAWLCKVDFFKTDVDILVDKKKLFRDVTSYVNSEYTPLIKSEGDESLVGPVVANATVYITEKDGEKKMYQNLWSDYLPGYQMKKLNLAIQTNSWDGDKVTKRYKDNLVGEYGCKDAYILNTLREFDESQHLNAGDEVIKHSDTGKVEDTDY